MPKSLNFEKDKQSAKRELLRKIKIAGIFIGSRAWKVEREDSDYDYLIKRDLLQNIFNFIEDKYREQWAAKELFEQSWGDSCDQERLREFYSIIIIINERRYNIISPMDSINYNAWKQSALIFNHLIGYELIKQKNNRVQLFECLKIFTGKFIWTKRKRNMMTFHFKRRSHEQQQL